MTDEARAASELAIRTPVRGWRAAFPPAQWLAAYRPQWLPRDAIAGITLAAYAIPVSLAYASLAGLPPQYGIYCYLVGGVSRTRCLERRVSWPSVQRRLSPCW